MIFDKFGNLWIGTNIGLSKLDIRENKFTSYTKAEGLTNNFINSILLDDDNNLFFVELPIAVIARICSGLNPVSL